jgi:uncharacterized protein (TIGR03067 family)
MRQDLDLLQGSWTVSTLEVDGQAMPDAMLADARVVVKGDRFTTTGMGAEYKGRLTLNPRVKPAQLDMKFDAGPEKGNTNLGIYELKGDRWRLCLATRGPLRPSKFASIPDSGIALETLVRGDAAAAAKPKPRAAKKPQPTGSGPSTEFEGEWSMLSGVMSGQPMDESSVQWVKRVTRGNVTTVMAGPQTMIKVEFTYDGSKSPGAIDYVNLHGSNKGKSQKGIYELSGDVLKFCVAAPGAERPSEFESVRGDGRTLTVWKRG